ncbi:(Fe-S)-binding protein [Methylomonas paludis]|uniref:Glycolate oxidase iron-sulfur subunit n=1 Tax=Methylomonas paludis TaxID=1173101 RepID=A0A975MPI4_9GAMM|nr:(Fe-S)-binding protein [Methylomonas paludis]QWF71126.1 (Fe-S)-binding protein [Methylomonas paludis]
MFDFMDFGSEDDPVAAPDGPYIPEAAECMRCGMCVSHCPTFRLFEIDEETPRRRIRTISKILVSQEPVSSAEHQHLRNCVQCRACETVCPSRMAYGALFDQALATVATAPGRLAKLALWLIDHKNWRAALMPALVFYRKSGLQALLRATGILLKLGVAETDAIMTTPAMTALAGRYRTSLPCRGRVALFSGCIAEHFDRENLTAAIKLLNAIAYDVLVPAQQSCCGAIHQHNGITSQNLIENNLAVFNALDVEAVLYAASGCGAMLHEYQSEDTAAAQVFHERLQDINQFLLSHWPTELKLRPASIKVAVHEPCSQRNVLKNQQAVYALLEKIPELSIAPLADNNLCCGAGGSYMLTHPGNAQRLRAMKLDCISAAPADVVLSSNFACTAFLQRHGAKLCHPVKLLALQLPINQH